MTDIPPLIDLEEENLKIQALEAHLNYYSTKPKQEQRQQITSFKSMDDSQIESQLSPKEVEEFEQLKQLAQKYIDQVQENIEEDKNDNQTLEELIQKLEEEKETVKNRQKSIQIKLNNYKLHKVGESKISSLNLELDLVSQNLVLIDRVQSLYRDKILLRRQNQMSSNLVTSLLASYHQLAASFATKFNELIKYYDQLPNEREIQLREELRKLHQEQAKWEYIQSEVLSSNKVLEDICLQADEARKLVIQQLRNIRQVPKVHNQPQVAKLQQYDQYKQQSPQLVANINDNDMRRMSESSNKINLMLQNLKLNQKRLQQQFQN